MREKGFRTLENVEKALSDKISNERNKLISNQFNLKDSSQILKEAKETYDSIKRDTGYFLDKSIDFLYTYRFEIDEEFDSKIDSAISKLDALALKVEKDSIECIESIIEHSYSELNDQIDLMGDCFYDSSIVQATKDYIEAFERLSQLFEVNISRSATDEYTLSSVKFLDKSATEEISSLLETNNNLPALLFESGGLSDIHFILRKETNSQKFISKKNSFDKIKGNIFNSKFFNNIFLFDSSKIYFNSSGTNKIDEVEPSLRKLITGGVNNKISDFSFSDIPHDLYIKRIDGLAQNMYIGGLISKSSYNKKVSQIDPFLIGLILLLLILILIFFPIWKLIFMNQYDELERSDVYLVSLSLVAGAFYIIIVLFSLYTHLHKNKVTLKNTLSNLSYKINHEIDAVFTNSKAHLLELNNQVDSLSKSKNYKSNLEIMNDPSLYNDSMQDMYWYKYEAALFLNEAGKLNSISTQLKNVSTNIQLNSRKYFTDAKQQNGRYFSVDSIGNRYYFQSIYSYTTNMNQFAISTPAVDSNRFDIKVIALIHRLDKFIEPILPLGFSYSMIDKSGRVLLHSNKDKILRENFTVECDENADLKDAIYNRKKEFIKLYYSGAEHYVCFQPIENTPFYLALMYDMGVQQRINTRINVYMVSFLSSNVLLIILLTLITLIIFRKKFSYSDTKFIHTWLFFLPAKDNKYTFLFFSYLLIALIYAFFMLISSNLLIALCLSWTVIIGANILNFTVLNGISSVDIKTTNTSDNVSDTNLSVNRLRMFYAINSFFILFIIYIFFAGSESSGTNSWEIFFFVLLVFLIFSIPVIYLYRAQLINKIVFVFSSWKSVSSMLRNRLPKPHYLFPLFFTCWIVLISVIPGLHYYKSIYVKEYNLWKFYEFNESVKHIEGKIRHYADFYLDTYNVRNSDILPSLLGKTPEDFYNLNSFKHPLIGNFLDSSMCKFYFDNLREDSSKTKSKQQYHGDFTPTFSNGIYKGLRIVLPGISDEHQLHSLLNDSQSHLGSKTNIISQKINLWNAFNNLEIKATITSSDLLSFNLFFSNAGIENKEKGVFFILISFVFWTIIICAFIFLVILGLWLLVTYVMRNIAYYRFDEILQNRQFEIETSTYPTISESTIPDKIYKPLYIFSSSGEKKPAIEKITELIKTISKSDGNKYNIINCTNINAIEYDEEQLIIKDYKTFSSFIDDMLIVNLDYNIKNLSNFKERVKILEWLYQFKKVNVTITSSSGLFRFRELYEELLRENIKDADQIKELENTWNKWVFLLRKFKRTILPMRVIKYIDSVENEITVDFVTDGECDDEKNKIFFAYQSIWTSLNQKEKILLLDLAEDGIINIKNNQALNMLIKKGLIVTRPEDEKGSFQDCPVIRIKRNSFKSFVLQLKDSGETKEIKRWINKKGNWANTKYILLILIVGLIIFIGFLEQSFVDRFVALFGASAAVIPMIFKLGQNLIFKKEVM